MSLDFWCEAIRRTKVDLDLCFKQIPPELRMERPILDAFARHPLVCDLQFCLQRSHLCRALLRRVSDRESLRECVRFAQADLNMWNPIYWEEIPQELWDDNALCLDLLAMLPILYGCLPDHLLYDADVVAALLAAKPEYHGDWAGLFFKIPIEIKLQRPDLVLRILKECRGSDEVANDLAPVLWRNREIALAIIVGCRRYRLH